MRSNIGAALVILILALTLAACGGKKVEEPEAVDTAGQETTTTPLHAAQENNVCLYLFWSRAPENAQTLLAEVQRGQNFSLAARNIMKPLPEGAARLNATCMPAGQLDPLLDSQLEGLDIGQTSPLFDFQDGTALMMRTTDQYWREGAALFKQGDYAQAEVSLRRHLELHPDATAVWQALSDALVAQGKNEPALEALDQALVYAPKNPAILNDKASLLARMGKQEEALMLYERALSLAPGSPLLMHNLAWALLEQKRDLERAQKLATKAVQMEPGQPRFWDTLGRIQKARGEYADAVISLHRAAALGAQSKGLQQDMAEALLKLPPEVVDRLGQRRSTPLPAKKAKPPAPVKAATAPQSDPLGTGAAPLPPVKAPASPQAEEATPAKLAAPAPTVPGYYVLVGSFRDQNLATKEMRRWRRRGQAVWMEWKQVTGRGFWVRVMLGPYQKRKKAIQEADSFQRQGLISSFGILKK
ncbi:MAG: tetratricopeptide repeat protein [Deltaproteobacteria bacterium]|nr:tetratricopeptide repeat protein [Deltaproteobacteria bacterium]